MAVWDVVVVGVDGCRDGWVAVVWDRGDLDVRYWRSLRQLEAVAGVEAVAIDIPLGLSANGQRRAESLARQRLPTRASTVFNVPPRGCLDLAADYAAANARSRRDAGKGLTRQSFSLLPKIGEADSYWASAPCPLYEVHPELSFARLNGGAPLAPKRTAEGAAARRALLRARGIELDGFERPPSWRALPDDLLDAAVCVWTAQLIVQGDVERLPDPPELDDTGREMCLRV